MRCALTEDDDGIIARRLTRLAEATFRATPAHEAVALLNQWVVDYAPTVAYEALRSYAEQSPGGDGTMESLLESLEGEAP